MYTSFQAKNFRCFRDLKIDDLSRINLIAGKNNVGKTALLEALFIHCRKCQPNLILHLNSLRGIQKGWKEPLSEEKPWDSIFFRFDSEIVELNSEYSDNSRLLVKLLKDKRLPEIERMLDFHRNSNSLVSRVDYVLVMENIIEGVESKRYYLIPSKDGFITEPSPPPPDFTARFISSRYHASFNEIAEFFGKLQVQQQDKQLLKVLQIIEPRLQDLQMVIVAGEPMLHGDIGIGRLLPFPFMGEGITKLAQGNRMKL